MSTDYPAQHRPKILVSDDDFNVRLLTRQCLEAENMVVVEASNGPETLDVFVRERPDLVFLDVEMPGMTGLEACQQIRELRGTPGDVGEGEAALDALRIDRDQREPVRIARPAVDDVCGEVERRRGLPLEARGHPALLCG